MNTFRVIPTRKGYWLVKTASDGTCAQLQVFKSEDDAVRLMQDLQAAAEAVERRINGMRSRPDR
jgi:hypothetical protein